ncbi:hypothetical protein BS47DRAFT_1342754 [Hydnum rufescens UP504]|uniref:Uncharacterized protein n=1 Tax=Hydnum rufescens UP504 TaxID=1448309 RepID=A0A9P6AZA0_9AGAM|nr:hypothetical protein BS47DRAFT_1342754 [Hydnum rufescens UP504]
MGKPGAREDDSDSDEIQILDIRPYPKKERETAKRRSSLAQLTRTKRTERQDRVKTRENSKTVPNSTLEPRRRPKEIGVCPILSFISCFPSVPPRRLFLPCRGWCFN